MVVSTSFVVLILCYWSGLISDEECERVFSLDDLEWRTQLEALQNEDINCVLYGRWRKYCEEQKYKVLIYVRPIYLVSVTTQVDGVRWCYYTGGWCEVVLLHRWMV